MNNSEPVLSAEIVSLMTQLAVVLTAFGVHVPDLSDGTKGLIAGGLVVVINLAKAFWQRGKVAPVAK